MAIRARVSGGRLVVDEPTLLPEGTTLDLVVAGEGDELDDAERTKLDASLAKSLDSVEAGRTRAAADLIGELRARR